MQSATTREGASDSNRPLALIAAGGEGTRLGSIGPKALVECASRPLLAWCLDAFAASEAFADGAGHVVVAAHASELAAFDAACQSARSAGLDVAVTAGGPSRSHSVAAAMRAGVLADGQPDAVFVHDAARIFISAELIDSLAAELAKNPEADAVIAASPVTDTIKRVDESLLVAETPPREQLWAVQTPQVFRAGPLGEALGIDSEVADQVLAAATDDASLVEARGGRVKVFNWSEPNGKITTQDDLAAADEKLSRAIS